MAPADLTAISRRVVDELWNRGDAETAFQVFEANYVNYDPGNPDGPAIGPLAMVRIVALTRRAFPDLRLQIEDQFMESRRVVTRWRGQGTHRGAWGRIAATGRQVEITGISVDRFFGPKIVETWLCWNTLGVLRQLGAIPSP